MIRLLIFDLDGTLLNTLEDLTDSTNYALKEFNFPTRTIEEVRNFVGNGVAKLIERAIPNGRENENFEDCLEVFKQNYAENMNNKTSPYEGIIDLLKELKSKNYKVAVVSNKFDLAVKGLCARYFADLVDIAIGENEKAGIKKKPAPDTVNQVLKNFNISNEEAIYIGDSEVDIMTAKNSNMDCISVTWGFKDKEFLLANDAKIIVNSPDEIISILEHSAR